MLNVHRFGNPDNPTILALHGLTGHGRRWEDLATNHLAEFHVIAPDLRGHGRSPWTPPWRLEDVAGDLVELIDEPVIVVGHSFGGAVSLHLAHAHPELVKALVLLDPAIGLRPEMILEHVTGTLKSPDYADETEARLDKTNGSWGEVPSQLLDAEVAEHLIPTDNGRVGWRMCIPAVAAFYGELARPLVLPSCPTAVVRALKVKPPYVTSALIDGLHERLGNDFDLREWDCDHMVAQARPAEVAELIRKVASAH
ncbi:alpha/beta fold hydrolase [Smaragdicoccus niigatensis]|uniref:alpha/beta fold hydrolase n=1 Tax=Smaragdicoccus niigatensis TaxID=359359 RepID=UPI0003812845|nr:alpha/beta hydrolase [Smaragdicoccus niigatensis]